MHHLIIRESVHQLIMEYRQNVNGNKTLSARVKTIVLSVFHMNTSNVTIRQASLKTLEFCMKILLFTINQIKHVLFTCTNLNIFSKVLCFWNQQTCRQVWSSFALPWQLELITIVNTGWQWNYTYMSMTLLDWGYLRDFMITDCLTDMPLIWVNTTV